MTDYPEDAPEPYETVSIEPENDGYDWEWLFWFYVLLIVGGLLPYLFILKA